MIWAAAAALVFVVLHRGDGGEIRINPAQVTALRSVPGRLSRQLIGRAQCVVGLTDGKFAAVIEPCGEVKRLLETTSPP